MPQEQAAERSVARLDNDLDTAPQTGPERVPVAVALKDRRGNNADSEAAARVVATGRGAVARQILEIAFASGVRVREDADLAEVLAALEIDSDIPIAAFAAICEILTYVYRANGEPEPDAGPEPAPAREPATAGDPA